jgi:glyoxylase-like metal-dependent hydrolase (beta-lactamase superfamily II)
MIVKQYYLGCLSHASYLVADEVSRVAAIVDPQRDVDQYLADAKAMELSVRHVLLTHFHADFVSGHLELKEKCGAEIHLGACGDAEYDFTPAHEGDTIDLGPQVRMGILETPGHTPESICILVHDLAKSADAPHAVLTGDTLFIGDVGRPDLLASVGITAQELAGMLYDSLRGKLLPLPDETLVYPAHGAGSACGKNLSSDTVSTMGVQRRYNHALQPMSKAEFVRLVTADQPDAPAYFSHDAVLNRQDRPTLEESLRKALRPLALAEVLDAAASGGQVVDVRDPAQFAGAHLAGAVNVGLGGKFAHWCGSVLDRTRPIVLVAEPGREQEAALRLGRIGFDHVLGYLQDGMGALEKRPELVRRTERIAPATLAERLGSAEAPLVLDVRGGGERQQARIEPSIHVPLNHLEGRLREVPRDRPVVIHCASGYRSSIAASLLQRHGVVNVTDLVGGIAAWQAAGLPTAGQGASCSRPA